MRGIYTKKFEITDTDRIATAGSCFAQHIARHLRSRSFTVLDLEPPPKGMLEADARRFGYSLYSCRYGNIYTARQLKQLVLESIGHFAPSETAWERQGRYYDAHRPGVEPNGLESPAEVLAHREAHLRSVRALLKQTDVFIFTFGLTEAWTDASGHTVFPMAPGTIAGQFEADRYAFQNFDFPAVRADFLDARKTLKRMNPNMRFLLTVSPVPLTATASGNHVLPATMYSKAVLRAVAGSLASEFEDIDYFPSFEIITNPAARSAFYGENLRTIEDDGVASVMHVFFAEHGGDAQPAPAQTNEQTSSDDEEDDVVCEEMLLDAFGRQ